MFHPFPSTILRGLGMSLLMVQNGFHIQHYFQCRHNCIPQRRARGRLSQASPPTPPPADFASTPIGRNWSHACILAAKEAGDQVTGIFSCCKMWALPGRTKGRGKSVGKGFQSEGHCGLAGMSLWLAVGLSCESYRRRAWRVSLNLGSWVSGGWLGECVLECGKGYGKRCTGDIGSRGGALTWVRGLGRPPFEARLEQYPTVGRWALVVVGWGGKGVPGGGKRL